MRSRTSGLRRGLVVGCWLLIVGGCDPVAAPLPPTSGDAAGFSVDESTLLPPPPSLAKGGAEIRMILPRAVDGTMMNWEQVARRVAGRSNAVIDLDQPDPNGPANQQAKLIAQAIRAGVDGILVAPEAEASPGLAEALAEAKRRQIPIVALARPLAEGDQAATIVARADPVPPARQLIKALVDDAGIVGLSQEGPVLVIVNADAREADAREAAVVTALADIGLPLFGGTPKRFKGRYEEAKQFIEAARKEDPKLPMVISTDEVGFRAAMAVRGALPPDERFVFAGFTADPETLSMVRSSYASAAVDCNEFVLARVAAEQLIAAMKGEVLPPRVDVELKFERAPGPPSEKGIGAPPEIQKRPTDAPPVEPAGTPTP